MKAIWYERTGPAREVLQPGEVPTPTPGRGQVLIRVHASGVNPSDAGMRAGPAPMAYPRIIPNSDGAGVVEAVGPETPVRWVGRRVWFYNGQRNGRAFGSAAEYIELDADLVTPLPDNVAFAEGAQQGVRQGVEAGVGVGMANEGRVMGDADSAEPDPIARTPAMGVDALTHPDVAGGAGKGLGHVEILRPGKL